MQELVKNRWDDRASRCVVTFALTSSMLGGLMTMAHPVQAAAFRRSLATKHNRQHLAVPKSQGPVITKTRIASADAGTKVIPLKVTKAAVLLPTTTGNTEDVTLDFVAADINDILKGARHPNPCKCRVWSRCQRHDHRVSRSCHAG